MHSLLSKRLFPCIDATEEEKNQLSARNIEIDKLFEQGKIAEAEQLKGNSITRLTFLFPPWICNFRCPNYCYTKGTADGTLTAEQTINIISQSREMGANVTYWPGMGELTLLKEFWQIMDWQAKQEIPAVLFTNGSVFHDDLLGKAVLGISSKEFMKKLGEKYPNLHLYVKYWHSSQKKAAEMVGVQAEKYPYTVFEGSKIPLALANLLENIDK